MEWQLKGVRRDRRAGYVLTAITVISTVFVVGLGMQGRAQEPAMRKSPARYLRGYGIFVIPKTATPGQTVLIQMRLQVTPGFHVNAHQPGDPNLIPLTFTPKKQPGITYATPTYNKPKSLHLPYSDKPVNAYDDEVVVTVRATVATIAKPGSVAVGGTLRAQGCNDSSCLPPIDLPLTTPLTVQKKP